MQSKYLPEYCEQLIEHMASGFSFESFGGVVKCARRTLFDWKKAFPEFNDAYEIGSTASQLKWEREGMDGLYSETTRDASGGSTTRSMNATVWIFNMKNRFAWKDRSEITGDPNKPIVLRYSLEDEETSESDAAA